MMKETAIAILLALLVAAISVMALMNKSQSEMMMANNQQNFNQLWTKLDRVTAVMMQKETELRSDLRDMRNEIGCQGKDIERLKTLNGDKKIK